MAALGRSLRGFDDRRLEHGARGRRDSCSRRRQLCDRGQHPATMSDQRNAEILQIVRGQVPNNLIADLIVAKGGFVLSEVDASQPLADVHNQVLAMVNRSPFLAIPR